MKSETYEILGNEWTVNVPTTEKEYNDNAKRGPAACVDDAVDHTIWHSTAGDAREALVKLIEEDTKITRRNIGTGEFVEKDGKKVETTKKETHGAYYKRVCAEKGLDPNKEGGAFPHLAKLISVGGANEVKFDASVTRSEAKPKKLPAIYIDAATAVINNGNWEKNRKVLAEPMATPENPKGKGFYGKDIGEQPKDREVAITTLGWAIREYTLNKQAAEAKTAWK